MPIRELKDQIARLPEQPGVYLYFNAAGETIYVGKARALRDRVRNYLGAYGIRPEDRRAARRDRAARVHRHRLGRRGAGAREQPDQAAQPKYNILLRDDKNYPYLQLTTNEAFPRVLVARRVERDGSFYAGPFLPATLRAQDDVADAPAVRHPVVQRGDHREARSSVPRVRHQALHRAVRRHRSARRRSTAARSGSTELFLEGKNDELIETLRARMLEAAGAERFEEAAQLRDAMRTVQTLARSAAEDGDDRAGHIATCSA